ncbi:hypothetical protein FRC12_003738 [Ceratobasidium sp. 428]|nr:hypothetical protein FRC12_003738 [Ceratobasidium sp. 428]
MRPRSYLAWLSLLLCQVASQAVNQTVDDSLSFSPTNPGGIQYFPSESSWSSTAPADLPQRFNQTIHLTNTDSTRVIYFFQGNAIFYYGDKGPGYGVLTVNVDGEAGHDTVNASSSTLEYQQLLWSRTGLGPGDHQIILSKEDGNGSNQVSMDYFRVESSNGTIVASLAGPGASVVPKEAVIVDNTDNKIRYSGEWESIQSTPQTDSGYNRDVGFLQTTVHRTKIPGAAATFTFVGAAVWYFSDVDWTHGFVQISVDGAEPEKADGYRDPHLSQRLIWYRTGLSPGQHVVTIAHGGQPTQYATVDFLMYLPSNATASAPNSNPSGTNASSASNENKTRPIQVGVIIGAVLGGVIGLGAFICGAFILYWRRMQRKRLAEQPDLGATGENELYESTPFILAPQTQVATRPTHRVGAKQLNMNSQAVSSNTGTAGMSEHSYSTSDVGTSRGFADYNPHDRPPSYR